MKTKERTRPIDRQGVNYVLPVDLIRQIKMDAALKGRFPAHVVTERLRDSFRREPVAPASTT